MGRPRRACRPSGDREDVFMRRSSGRLWRVGMLLGAALGRRAARGSATTASSSPRPGRSPSDPRWRWISDAGPRRIREPRARRSKSTGSPRAGDDLARIAHRRAGVDVVLGGPASAYSRMARAGVLAAIEPSERLPWRVVRRSPIGLATATAPGAGEIAPPSRSRGPTFDDPRHDPLALAWAKGELGSGGWAEGYARLVQDAAHPRRIGRQAGSALAALERGEAASTPAIGSGEAGLLRSEREPLTRPPGTLSRGERGLCRRGGDPPERGAPRSSRGLPQVPRRSRSGRPPAGRGPRESRGGRVARRPAGRDARRRPGRALGCLGGPRARRSSRAGRAMDDAGPSLASRVGRDHPPPGSVVGLAGDPGEPARPRRRRPRLALAELAPPDAAHRRRLARGAGRGGGRATRARAPVPRLAPGRVEGVGPPALSACGPPGGVGRPLRPRPRGASPTPPGTSSP